MLELENLNYLAVMVAWLINVVVGAFWYSPAGFGKQWSAYTGVDMMKIPKDRANKIISFVAVSGLVQAFVLGLVLNTMNINGAVNGLVAGLVICFGLTAATTVGNALYAGLSWKLIGLNSAYFFVVMGINSVIFAVWQ